MDRYTSSVGGPSAFEVSVRFGWPIIALLFALAVPPFPGSVHLIGLLAISIPANSYLQSRCVLKKQAAPYQVGHSVILRQTVLDTLVGILLLPFLLAGCLIGGLLEALTGGSAF